VLLYVTTDEGKERKARPLHTIPDTINLLFDLGMREHDRAALLLHPEGKVWAETPDWRFDREVIRIGLFLRERLHVPRAQRIAIFGPLCPLWLSADLAALGLGTASVGVSHLLGDDLVLAALDAAEARVAIATDGASTSRLLGLRPRAARLELVVGPEGNPDDKAFVPLAKLLDYGATLDTAERASRFRLDARAVGADEPACWHYGAKEAARGVRLTHREAMARVRSHLRRLPAQAGDLAYLEGEAVTLEARFAWYAFTGDGYTTMVVGRPERSFEDVRDLRPAKILATPAWLGQLWDRLEAEPAGKIERLAAGAPGLGGLGAGARARRLRRALRACAGDRLRWVEPVGVVAAELKQKLAQAVTVVESAGPIPVPGPDLPGGRPEAPANEPVQAT
jgi:long-subunit acyl-CoA synthetase (AMP-forming)